MRVLLLAILPFLVEAAHNPPYLRHHKRVVERQARALDSPRALEGRSNAGHADAHRVIKRVVQKRGQQCRAKATTASSVNAPSPAAATTTQAPSSAASPSASPSPSSDASALVAQENWAKGSVGLPAKDGADCSPPQRLRSLLLRQARAVETQAATTRAASCRSQTVHAATARAAQVPPTAPSGGSTVVLMVRAGPHPTSQSTSLSLPTSRPTTCSLLAPTTSASLSNMRQSSTVSIVVSNQSLIVSPAYHACVLRHAGVHLQRWCDWR